jgi:hypothetical protein
LTWPFLDEQERALVAAGLPLCGAGRAALEEQLVLLGGLAELTRRIAFDASPEAIVALLGGCRYDADLRLPPLAAVGRAYTLAKVSFLRELSDALAGAPAALRRRAEEEHAQSIHSHLVEELFIEIAADPTVDAAVRGAAGRKLRHLWQDPIYVEVDDVAPLLDAIWEARSRLRPVLGTLVGCHEAFALFQSTRDERFLDHFSRDDVDQDELQAFHEFLLGLSTEEHAVLRSEMAARGLGALSPAEARAILGLSEDGGDFGLVGPEAMVASYRARKIKTSYRVLARTPGPRRTAEEHVVIARLARGDAL